MDWQAILGILPVTFVYTPSGRMIVVHFCLAMPGSVSLDC